MTSQIKQYIEVSEIIAFRCECRQCGTSLTLPIEKDVGRSLHQCPRCGFGWTRLQNSTNEVVVEQFAEKAKALADLMPHMGFTLTLELKGEVKP